MTTRRFFQLKIVGVFAAILCLLACRSVPAQSTNTPAVKKVQHIDLKIDYGFGRVLMSEQPAVYAVQLPMGKPAEEGAASDANSLDPQVWLLKTDGTTVPARARPTHVGIGMAGRVTHYMMYTFDKVPADELAGIVVRAGGKLFCEEIGTERK